MLLWVTLEPHLWPFSHLIPSLAVIVLGRAFRLPFPPKCSGLSVPGIEEDQPLESGGSKRERERERVFVIKKKKALPPFPLSFFFFFDRWGGGESLCVFVMSLWRLQSPVYMESFFFLSFFLSFFLCLSWMTGAAVMTRSFLAGPWHLLCRMNDNLL